ncbi:MULTISPECIES: type VII secretion-associated serine protease mycosin [unclassified Streptomyces]|uniref:type VII secretion-associated serine protease mycosin n=1 Tax=unclassified Streptomyces TaxID=2593676 RepID=UPI00081D73A5|nr:MULTISPECIES: type VII secretion-associated serine protease mycosin [unclassified Streptomyces]MYZ36527.1 type VII secretion-associated serine protease mycosin [Streptomyces sp. SID4917]SCF84312.1 type VII secretion-associated serine protease mycosin [Streptomyces sp. MnatMP-M17]
MRASSIRTARWNVLISGSLGLLLAGVAATPAHAETVRSRQWHLDIMKAEEMWRTSTGEGVTVAVIDSGVDPEPDLEGQVLPGKDFSVKPGDERDDISNHGTGMAALIAATGKSHGGDGAFGLAPGAKILPIRVDLSAGRQGDEKEAEAIRYAGDSAAKIINISQGGLYDGAASREAVKYALGKGKLIFAAVGNDGRHGAPKYPAATPGVIGVGAVGKDLKATEESQTGLQVDLVAPGIDIINACAGETGLCNTSGTSDASALASASAALIWSKYPDWTNNQVLRVMLNTAGGPTSGAERNDYVGYGMVRPRIALTDPGDPGPADEYPLPDLAAAASKAPSPEASKEAGGGAEDGKGDETQPPAPAAAADDGGNTGLWIGLGVGAALLIGAAVAVPLVRSRRRAAAPAQQPPAFAPVPYQQTPYPPQQSQQSGPPQYGPPQYGPPPQQYPQQQPNQAPQQYPPYGPPRP